MLIQVFHRLLKRGNHPRFFIVCWKDDAEAHLRGLDVAGVRGWVGFVGLDVLLLEFALGEPAVVPAGELFCRADAVGGMAGDVGLFGGEDWSGFGCDEVEEEEELEGLLARIVAAIDGFRWCTNGEECAEDEYDEEDEEDVYWCCVNPGPERT